MIKEFIDNLLERAYWGNEEVCEIILDEKTHALFVEECTSGRFEVAGQKKAPYEFYKGIKLTSSSFIGGRSESLYYGVYIQLELKK